MLAFGGWKALGMYLLLWVVPAFTVLQVILRLRAVCEHGAATDLSSPLTAARTHKGFEVTQLLAKLTLFPHHVNYHIEHHLYPAAPDDRLRELHALLRRRGLLIDADVSGFAATLQKVFAAPPRA